MPVPTTMTKKRPVDTSGHTLPTLPPTTTTRDDQHHTPGKRVKTKGGSTPLRSVSPPTPATPPTNTVIDDEPFPSLPPLEETKDGNEEVQASQTPVQDQEDEERMEGAKQQQSLQDRANEELKDVDSGAFGEDGTTWTSKEDEHKLLVPVGSASDSNHALTMSKAPSNKTLSHQLAHALGCFNVYYKDQDIDNEHFVANYTTTSHDTQYMNINTRPYRSQTFLGQKLKYGKYVLSPLLVASSVFLAPHGTLDKTKVDDKGKIVDAVEHGHERQAAMEISFRPDFFSSFSGSNDGGQDLVVKDFLEWARDKVEPRVRSAIAAIGRSGSKGWASSTSTIKDPFSLAMFPSYKLLRTPKSAIDGDLEKVVALTNGSYKAPTDLLTKLCLKNAMEIGRAHV